MKWWNKIDLCYRKISQCVIVRISIICLSLWLPKWLSHLTRYLDDLPIFLWQVIKYSSTLVQRSLQTLILLHVLFLWRNLYLCLNCSEPTRVSVTSRFKAKPWFFKIYPNDFFCCLQCRRLIRANYNFIELAIVYSTGHVWFGVRVDGEGKGAWKDVFFIAQPPPLSFFLIFAHPLGTIFFSLPSLSLL